MKFALIPNLAKDPDFQVTCLVASLITKHGGQVLISDKYARAKDICPDISPASDFSGCDMIVCLGGDGTFLTAIQETLNLNRPLVGVNLGSLGFLAEINLADIEESFGQIFAGNYKIQKRMMIDTVCRDSDGHIKEKATALNDIVISRCGISRILDLHLLVDDVPIEKIPGDGIIISSPTGSTAYSLSAGGPIIQPDLSLILINPINPHTLHDRCYVVGEDSVVRVQINDYPHKPLLTADGFAVCELEEGDEVTIKKSAREMQLVKLKENGFYESISSKIFNRGRIG